MQHIILAVLNMYKVHHVEMFAQNHLSLCSIYEVPMPTFRLLLQFEIFPENVALFFSPDFPVRIPQKHFSS